MTKKMDTEPKNAPAAPAKVADDAWLDAALDEFAKPQMLDHKEKGAESEGRDAVEYEGRVHVPPARMDHNTFPNAPVIVSQTDPGIGPPNPLNVTPEERKKLEQEFDYRRKLSERAAVADERNVDTGPRKTDPPGVATDPPKHTSPLPKVLLALIASVGICIVAFVATRQPKPTQTDSATTATVSAAAPVTTTTASAIAPTATNTVITPPVHTATAPAATSAVTNHVYPPTTAVTTTTVAPPTTTATSTSTSSIFTGHE